MSGDVNHQERKMKVAEGKIISMPALTIVGLRYGSEGEFGQVWDKLIPRMDEIKHRSENGWSYGVIHNDPVSGDMRYLAGFGVDGLDEIPDGMTALEVPMNRYAAFPTTLKTIGETFDHIFHEWLPDSGYEPGSGPSLEVYDENFNGGDSTFYIYVPIQESP
jgi:AraC family transcriptional regulator